jgi:hypothetical protein
VTLLTWEQYDLGLQNDAVFVNIIEALGGPFVLNQLEMDILDRSG